MTACIHSDNASRQRATPAMSALEMSCFTKTVENYSLTEPLHSLKSETQEEKRHILHLIKVLHSRNAGHQLSFCNKGFSRQQALTSITMLPVTAYFMIKNFEMYLEVKLGIEMLVSPRGCQSMYYEHQRYPIRWFS